ncbi:MAG TPA: hypothetical protein VNA20_14855 [Frankiaceae bacterium]|nr:hypothetical protein [Frankiaceae bacterium]
MRRATAALAALLALSACDSGGRTRPSRGPAEDRDPGIPAATNHRIESISVHTLTWLSATEVLTVEFPDPTTAAKTPTWVIVDATTGTTRRVTPPAPADCAGAVATGPARIRDGVVAYVEHCPDPKRSRVLSYDVATGRATPLADAGAMVLEHVTVGRDGRPAFVGDVANECTGLARVSGARVADGPLTAAPGWDLAAPLRGTGCAGTGRAAFARIDRTGRRVAFVGSPPGTPNTYVYVSAVTPFAPERVGPPIPSVADLTWSGDGKAVYVTSRGGTLIGVSRVDLATGAVERLYDKTVTSIAASPDGTRLAILKPRPDTTTLAILPVP